MHRGTNAIGILAARNDWFQNSEILEVIAAIRAATPDFHLVGYGGSMGAYAAINFADLLPLRRVIAVCPQFSINAARAPYETRWRAEAEAIEASGGFAFDRIGQVPRITDGWVIFDPASTDRLHIAAIQRHHALCEVRVRFGGHEMMRLLQQADVFTPMLLDMLDGSFDLAAFRRAWRQARRRSAVYWLAVSALLLRRGNAAGAMRAVIAARSLPHPEPAETDLAACRAHLALGEVEQAKRLARAWDNHPAWGEAARACLLACATAPAPPARPLFARLQKWLRVGRSGAAKAPPPHRRGH